MEIKEKNKWEKARLKIYKLQKWKRLKTFILSTFSYVKISAHAHLNVSDKM
jgi:hypothetical protein